MSRNKYRLAVLASGNGSNLQAIIDSIENNSLPDAEIVIVISDCADAYALKRAKNHSIDNVYLNLKEYDTRESFDAKIVKILNSYKVDLVILAGYMKIITSLFLNVFRDKILNIHPSLLPDFGGVNMYGVKVHKAVISAGCEYSGCSVHVVTEEVDMGPIVDQIKVKVLDSDTPEALGERILTYEHKLYPRAINKYLCSIYQE